MGVDGAKPESVVNLTGNRQAVLWTANVALVAGGLLLWRVIQQVVRLDLLVNVAYAIFSSTRT